MNKLFIGVSMLIIFCIIALSYNSNIAHMIDQFFVQQLRGNEGLALFHGIGNSETIIGVTLVFALILITTKKAWKPAIFTICTVGLGFALNQSLKSIFARPRPDIADQLSSYSFPSGHAMMTTIYLLTIIFIIQQVIYSGHRIYIAYGVAFFIIIGVALSRVAMERHFFTDVTAGISLGIAFVIGATFIYKKNM